MSINFAELVLAANTRDLKSAQGDLRSLTKEGERTEKRTSKALGGIGKAARLAGGALAALGAVSWATGGIREARAYGAAMAEVSTLIEGTPKQMKAIEVATRGMAKQYGSSAQAQAKAYYQAVSGGASAGAEATALLDTANRLAIGGVTDVTTAVDILTTATNVYGAEGLKASEASDALFVAMKAGKTDITQLSASLGKVLPLAQKMGVGFDEVAAATAALTTGGISTAESVTGMRAALTAVTKPSKQAADLAESLGLNFSSAGLEAQGFAGFMAEVVNKTGGSVDQMAELFGSTEATAIALALAGEAGVAMGKTLDAMTDKAGATDDAFFKMSKDMDQRLAVVRARFTDLQIGVGDALLTVLVPVMEKAANAAEYFANAIPVEQISAAATALMQWQGVDELAIGLGALGAAAAVLASPFIAVTAAIGGAAAAATYLYTNWADISERFPGITGALTSAVGLISDAFTAIMPSVQAVGEFAVTQITSMVQLIDGLLRGDFAGAWASAKEIMTNWLSVFDLFKPALAAGVAQVRQFGADIVAALRAMGSEALAAAKAIGTDIVAGLKGGIQQKWADLRSYVSGLGTGMLDGLKNKLGIRSPSREFKKLGVHSVDGLIVGMESRTDALQDQVRGTAQSAVDGAGQTLEQGFGSMVDYMFDGFKDGMSGLLDIFKNTLKQMAATALKNRISIGFGLSGSVAGATGAAAAPASPLGGILGGGGAIGGGGGLLSGLLGNFGSGGSILGFGGLSGGTGFLGGLGNAVSGGLGNLFSVGANAAAAGGGLAASIGSVLPVLGIAAAAFSFFRKSVKELDAGMRVTIDGMDTLVESFRTLETKRFWGLSKKVRTSYAEAEGELADPLMKIIGDMQASVLTMAGALGVGADVYRDFAHSIELSTKGMSEEEAQQAVAEAIQGVGDAFAAMTPQLARFTREGEESTAALTRIVSDLGAVNLMMDTLGHTMFEASVIGAGTASNFAAMFGGIEAMNTATTAYYQGFYSEAERLATSQRQLGAQFEALNMAMPRTRTEFRSMVESMDLTTAYGRQAYAALVSMSGALDAALPAIATFTAEISAMADGVLVQIDAIVAETNTVLRANDQAATLWARTASTLRDVIADMRATASELNSPAQARAFSAQQFQSVLASAMSGDSAAAQDAAAAGRTLIDNTRATARTALEVARIEARVISGLQGIAGQADIASLRHSEIAGLLGSQVDVLGELRDAISGGDPLTASDIAAFSARLGSLQGSIKEVGDTSLTALDSAASITSIISPIGKLRSSLGDLASAIIAEGKRADRVAADAAKLTSLQSSLGTLALRRDNMTGDARGVINRIRDLEASTGVSLRNGSKAATLGLTDDGSVRYKATAARYDSSADIERWRAEFWGKGGLEDQLQAIRRQPKGLDSQMDRLRSQIRGLGGIPAFATGVRNFEGGLARIHDGGGGEIVRLPNGTDVIPHDLSKRMVDKPTGRSGYDAELLTEMRALRREVADLRKQAGTFDSEKVRYARKNNQLLERQELRNEDAL